MNLRQIRKSKGFSQEAIARQIDISLRQYQRYENQEFIPKLATARKLSEILGVPMDEILAAATN